MKETAVYNGILNVMKPPGMTSFDVVAFLRRVLRMKKIGHTGTLDPLAVGVLPVCAGNATKAIEYMVEKDKLYRAELTLGISTDTQDASGEVLSVRAADFSEEAILHAVQSFCGKYLQVPPMYSAIKVNGKKLYELAREGVTIERNAREVEIFSIRVVKIWQEPAPRVLMDVHCSKGTYIRTLCADIGDRLGCGGHMSFLLRKKAGPFDLSSSLLLEEIEDLAGKGELAERLQGVEDVFSEMPVLQLDAGQERRFLNGAPIGVGMRDMAGTSAETNLHDAVQEGLIRIHGPSGVFLGLGEVAGHGRERLLRSKKLF